MRRCEHCGASVTPKANISETGDGCPDVYNFYAWCIRCNRETDLNGQLDEEEKELAIRGKR